MGGSCPAAQGFRNRSPLENRLSRNDVAFRKAFMLILPTIGATIIYNGCAYRFCGTTPTSVQPTMAWLQDLRTGFWSEVPAIEFATTPWPPAAT
jgi:hypothetical protein